MMREWLSGLVLATALAGLVVAAEPQVVFTDPAQAGPDFAVQGEYVGTIQTDEGAEKWGAQIIALGDGKFRAVGYPGGLPGDGWQGGERIMADGQRSGDAVEFTASDDGRAAWKDGVLTIPDETGGSRGKLEKVERKSSTLSARPPQGAVVLFDGSTAGTFQGGRMTDDGLLREGATSKQKFQSFSLHIEFRTPFQPEARGQGRGNSGFYAQGRYKVQILDSFGLDGEDNECGGIYKIARPRVNMCYPPLAWQTYDVDYTAARYENGRKVANARITVKHNGVLIHQNVELPHATTAAPVAEGPDPGPIYLQDHGNPVRFRNIWLIEK